MTSVLVNLEDPQFRGTLTVSTDTYPITSVELRYMLERPPSSAPNRTVMTWLP